MNFVGCECGFFTSVGWVGCVEPPRRSPVAAGGRHSSQARQQDVYYRGGVNMPLKGAAAASARANDECDAHSVRHLARRHPQRSMLHMGWHEQAEEDLGLHHGCVILIISRLPLSPDAPTLHPVRGEACGASLPWEGLIERLRLSRVCHAQVHWSSPPTCFPF
jgi:hypothetical protein